MSFVNPKTKELFLKLVCVGPAGSGARDLVNSIASLTVANHTESLEELTLEEGAVSYFALGPESMSIKGLQVRLQIYGFAGPLPQIDSYLLRGVDGVVFCASSLEKDAAAVAFAEQLRSAMLQKGHADVPTILHYQSSGWRKKKPSAVLINAAQVAEQDVYITECKLSFSDAAAGQLPKKPDGIMATLKAVAKHALLALRDQVASPTQTARQPENDDNIAKAGNYTFVIPDFWLEWNEHSEPGKHRLSSIPAQNMTFDVLVVEDGGTQENREAYFDQLIPMYQAQSVSNEMLEIAGWSFRSARLENPVGLTQEVGAISELYAGLVGSDLFTFQINRGPDVPNVENPEKLRVLCLKMAEAAIIRRMNESPEQYS